MWKLLVYGERAATMTSNKIAEQLESAKKHTIGVSYPKFVRFVICMKYAIGVAPLSLFVESFGRSHILGMEKKTFHPVSIGGGEFCREGLRRR